MELGLRGALGPPEAAIRVHAALGEHEQYLVENAGWVATTYGDSSRDAFRPTQTGPRFAVLGGSTVHGGTANAGFDQEFPHRAARMLGVTALNLGSPGLDSHDLVRILDELDGVGLDALVVYTGHNDFGNAHFEGRYGTARSKLGAYVHAGFSRLQLFAQLSRLVRPITGAARRARVGMDPAAGEVHPLGPARQRMVLSGLEANLDRLAWTAGRRGLPTVFVVPVGRLSQTSGRMPCDRPDCPEMLVRRAREIAESDPEEAVRLLQRARDTDPIGLRAPTPAQDLVRQLGDRYDHVTVVDAFARLPRDARFDVPDAKLFVDPVHLSRRGHTQVGALVALALEPVFGVRADLPADAQGLRSGPP